MSRAAVDLPAPLRAPLAQDAPAPGAASRVNAIRWEYILLAVWLLSALYAAAYLRRGWIPHDEGTLGQAAERVLRGELPHRDFDDMYTGGLSFLHAAVFRVFGIDLMALRVVLYLFFLAWVPAVYYIASRFLKPLGAGVLVLVSVAWSTPNYVAALPSWYNLFFATFGIAAILRFQATSRTRWLFVAGLCGGLSILMKVVGLYYVAAALLFFAFREQSQAARGEEGEVSRAARSYSAALAGGLVIFLILLVKLVWSRLGIVEFVHYVLPPAALVGVLLGQELAIRSSGGARRAASFCAMGVPFLVGVALPLLALLTPYLAADAAAAWFRGVFVAPAERLEFAAQRPPNLGYTLVATLPLLAFLLHGRWRRAPSYLEGGAILLALAIVIALARESDLIYRVPWYAARSLGPIVVVWGAWRLLRDRGRVRLLEERRSQLFLLLCMTAMHSLVQFPYHNPWYFWYVAPLIVLSLAFLVTEREGTSQFAPLTTAGFYLIFAVLVVNSGSRFTVGSRYLAAAHTEPLSMARAGGIRVSQEEFQEYETLNRLLHAHARSEYIYAGPDSPQVYFLSGYRNPTRTMFDFFDDPRGRTDRILSALDAHGVTAVVINGSPSFSEPLPAELAARLAERFPRASQVGRFTVRWR